MLDLASVDAVGRLLLPGPPCSYVQTGAVATGCARKFQASIFGLEAFLLPAFRIDVAAEYRKKGTVHISLCALPFESAKTPGLTNEGCTMALTSASSA